MGQLCCCCCSFAEKIKDLFPDGSLDSFTKLALVNTVYFKGQWDREFKKENTKEEEFWLNKVWPLIYLCDVLTRGTYNLKPYLSKRTW